MYENEIGDNKLISNKDNRGKTPWEIFPFSEAKEVVKVFQYGAVKYGAPFTYRSGIEINLLVSAIIRHCIEILNGSTFDIESRHSHFAHIAANGLMGISQLMNEEKELLKVRCHGGLKP